MNYRGIYDDIEKPATNVGNDDIQKPVRKMVNYRGIYDDQVVKYGSTEGGGGTEAPGLDWKSILAYLEDILPALIAEFIGTFILALTVGCVVLGKANANWGPTAIAASLMVSIYSLAAVSGGNFNPAVSFALGLMGKLKWPSVGLYALVQLSAALFASLWHDKVLFGEAVTVRPNEAFSSDVVALEIRAITVELVYTWMLCFVVLSVAVSKRNNPSDDPNQFYAFAIGFVIVAGGYAGGSISGAFFNPALSLGFCLCGDFSLAHFGLAYAVAELAGAGLAVCCFLLTRPEEMSADDVDIDNVEPPYSSKLLGEFVGTFLLVFTVGLNVMSGSPCTGWSAAACLMCMIYSLGDVSGAHFNPAVSLGLTLRGACSWMDCAIYSLIQLIAGAIAGACIMAMNDRPEGFGAIKLIHGMGKSLNQASVLEMFFTSLLVFVVLSVATVGPPSEKTKHNFYFAFAIGSCITAAGFATGGISGAEINPAVTLGLYLGSDQKQDNEQAVILVHYWVAEIFGSFLAAGCFFAARPLEYSKLALPALPCFRSSVSKELPMAKESSSKELSMAKESSSKEEPDTIVTPGPIIGGNPAVWVGGNQPQPTAADDTSTSSPGNQPIDGGSFKREEPELVGANHATWGQGTIEGNPATWGQGTVEGNLATRGQETVEGNPAAQSPGNRGSYW